MKTLTQDPNPRLLKLLKRSQALHYIGQHDRAGLYDLLFRLEAFQPLGIPEQPTDLLPAACALYRALRTRGMDDAAVEVASLIGRLYVDTAKP